MDHETRFALDQQKATIDDAEQFMRYMASPSLYETLDMSSIRPAEGTASIRNHRIHTTRLITEHTQLMMNKAMGFDFYRSDEVSSLYRQGTTTTSATITKEEEVHTFGNQYSNYWSYENATKEKLMSLLAPSEPITDADIDREFITIRTGNSPRHLKIRIDNYVFVTYLYNKSDSRKRCKINLLDMAAKTLRFGIQYSEHKFSKNDIRYRWGSHLVFESGVLVETGSTNPLLAAKLLEHTMNIFRYVCGYHDIGICERRCDNVVATGSLNFGLCLELLKEKYPFVTYEKADFAGAIIRIKEIDMHERGNTASSATATIFDNEEEYVNHERGQVNIADEYNRKYNDVGNEAEQREQEVLKNMADAASTSYETMCDDFDISNILRNPKEKNIKALVFPYGRVICVGNKSREGVIESYSRLFPILESVRDTPENLKKEAALIRARRQTQPRKRRKVSEKEIK